MGLLDEFGDFVKTPEGQGLLSAAFGGMAGARPGQPINSLGRAGLAGIMGYGQAQDRQVQMAEAAQMKRARELQMAHQQMQIDEAKKKTEDAVALRALQKRFSIPAQPATSGGLPQDVSSALPSEFQIGAQVAPMAAQPASFDREGFGKAWEALDPINGFNYQQSIQKDNTPITVAPGASLVDKRTFKPLFTAPKDHPAPAEIQGYQYAVGQGYPGTFEQWTTSQNKSKATNVTTKIETKMGESLAGQVGPMVKDTYTAAQGAVQQVDAAKRIVAAIDSGKVITGPLAGARMTAAQIGQILGVTGKDDAETIARSREVIRGLAEMTLQGRKQMTGQGAITESEGKLAEKANSGDISELTAPEIKQLARASARASRFVYQQHEDNLKNLNSSPDTAKLGAFYKVRPLPSFDYGDQPTQQPSGGRTIDDLVKLHRSK